MHEEIKKRYHIADHRPMIALAPMAGVTDVPFRHICEQFGADYSVTEMAASAPQLLESEKNVTRLSFTPTARVKILQIIGNSVEHMSHAAKLYSATEADIIDINLGCPAKKVSKKGAGSALLSDLPMVVDILTAVVKSSSVPVTVKTRLGPCHDNYTLFDVANILSDLGIDLMTVHGRTRSDKFNGDAQFDEIARVKQAFPHLAVIANGDITTAERAKEVLDKTNCDGLMIGRGAMGNPWLFDDIHAMIDCEYQKTSLNKLELILEHIRQTQLLYGEVKGVRFARKHIQAYFEHLGIRDKFKPLAKINDENEQLIQVENIMKSYYGST